MRAVMYGAGNIGRGFIGARIVCGEGHTDLTITNVDAISGNDIDAVARAIAGADIIATAVGVNVMKFIAPNIAAGVRLRKDMGKGPLDINLREPYRCEPCAGRTYQDVSVW